MPRALCGQFFMSKAPLYMSSLLGGKWRHAGNVTQLLYTPERAPTTNIQKDTSPRLKVESKMSQEQDACVILTRMPRPTKSPAGVPPPPKDHHWALGILCFPDFISQLLKTLFNCFRTFCKLHLTVFQTSFHRSTTRLHAARCANQPRHASSSPPRLPQGPNFRVQDPGFKTHIQGSGLRVQSLCRGSGFKTQRENLVLWVIFLKIPLVRTKGNFPQKYPWLVRTSS